MRFAILAVLLITACVAASPEELWRRATNPYRAPEGKRLAVTNSPRLKTLVQDGKLRLTLADAVSLAVENNLDIEFQRFNREGAASELLRAKGGGGTRGLLYTIAEAPGGVGGPLASLATSPASRSLPATSVSSNPLELGALSQIQSNLALLPNSPFAAGPAVPLFDPSLFTRFGWAHTSAPQTNPILAGTSNLITNTTSASAGYRQGFGPGTQLGVSFDNSRQAFNSQRSSYTPFTTSALGLNFVQPLLRGFGQVNRRYIRIAENESRIADLLFQQQLIATVYGVSRLYYDYVSLYQDARVKQETLNFAERLFTDTKAQVEEGTVAQVELTRANAQVFAARMDVERARGLMEEQAAILRNVLTRTGAAEPEIRNAEIVPDDTANVPGFDIRPEEDLLSDAFRNRPDVNQAEYQVRNSEIFLDASRNSLKPQVDIVASTQNSGLAGELNPLAAQTDPTFAGGYGTALGQIFRRNYPTYTAGLQIDLPLRNRVAQADVARDEVQVRQTQVRMLQLRNQVRLEVEDALIAIRRARSSFEAASQARALQEESLRIEQAKYEAGASTSFFVLQYQAYLSQSRSAEVVARNALVKAQVALQRATGTILQDFGISIEKATQGSL